MIKTTLQNNSQVEIQTDLPHEYLLVPDKCVFAEPSDLLNAEHIIV